MSTRIILDEWEQALADAMGDRADKVPAGWITTHDWMAALGVSHSTANIALRKLFSANKAEKKMFRVQCGDSLRPVAHYRLKK